jgi:hypothetical protein
VHCAQVAEGEGADDDDHDEEGEPVAGEHGHGCTACFVAA